MFWRIFIYNSVLRNFRVQLNRTDKQVKCINFKVNTCALAAMVIDCRSMTAGSRRYDNISIDFIRQ